MLLLLKQIIDCIVCLTVLYRVHMLCSVFCVLVDPKPSSFISGHDTAVELDPGQAVYYYMYIPHTLPGFTDLGNEFMLTLIYLFCMFFL